MASEDGADSVLAAISSDFDDQVVVITGGAQGIGFGIAEYMGNRGATVVIFDINEDRCGEAVTALMNKGIAASFAAMNVTEPFEWEKAIQAVLSMHRKIDVLIQAAGITGKTGIQTHEVSPMDFDAVMSVNAKGVFLGCKYALPPMIKANYGRIVNITSIAGKEGNPGMLAYSASKGAVIALTKSVGKEYADTGITCNAIAPAVIKTPLMDLIPAEQLKYMIDKIPMKRTGTVDEVAAMVAFVASKGCSFTTGFTFDVSGGRATY